MRTIMAVTITIVCLVVLLQLQTLNAADEVKGPKVTEKVCGGDHNKNSDYRKSNNIQLHALVEPELPHYP